MALQCQKKVKNNAVQEPDFSVANHKESAGKRKHKKGGTYASFCSFKDGRFYIIKFQKHPSEIRIILAAGNLHCEFLPYHHIATSLF